MSVYSLAQRQLRQTLKRTKSTVKNKLGHPTNRPTLGWIFQCFQMELDLTVSDHSTLSLRVRKVLVLKLIYVSYSVLAIACCATPIFFIMIGLVD